MKSNFTDVDIDVFNREEILKNLPHVSARINRTDSYEKHNTGIYFQNIPHDPFTNIASIDHRVAKEYGYFKIDFLNVNMYEDVRDEEHLLSLMNKEPLWDFFQYKEITDQLFHLHGYSSLLCYYKPQSVEDLAMILAIIRPGKSHLQFESWDRIRQEVWIRKEDDDTYFFKKSHSLGYSLAILVHLNLIIEKMSTT